MMMSLTDASLMLAGRTVLVRVSPGEPMPQAALDALRLLLRAGARAAIIAGLGDPGGDINPALTLKPLAGELSAQLGQPVAFVSESVGAGAESGLASVPFGSAAVLENLRFHQISRRSAPAFAMRLAILGDFFLDLGATPGPAGGWQERLATLLPTPALPLQTVTLQQEF